MPACREHAPLCGWRARGHGTHGGLDHRWLPSTAWSSPQGGSVAQCVAVTDPPLLPNTNQRITR